MEKIAMKCTRKQYESVKDKVGELGIRSDDDFKTYKYLCNDTDNICFMDMPRNRIVYKEFNKEILFKALDIEIEETFKISKETVLKYDMREEFPECFEVKLEVGKVYKNNESIVKITCKDSHYMFDRFHYYGFNSRGFEKFSFDTPDNDNDGWEEATQKEWEDALINEAEKRGYKEGVLIVDIYNGKRSSDTICVSSNKFDYEKILAGDKQGDMALRDSDGNVIFYNGIWAEIVPKEIVQNGVTYEIKD